MTMAARRQDPRAHGESRADLKRELEAPAKISIAIAPLTPDDLALISKTTGYSIQAVRTLAKVYSKGGLKSAGSAAFGEGIRLAGAGWKTAADKAQKLKS